MSCSYVDTAMAKYDCLANEFHLRPRVWERFRDNIFAFFWGGGGGGGWGGGGGGV